MGLFFRVVSPLSLAYAAAGAAHAWGLGDLGLFAECLGAVLANAISSALWWTEDAA